MGKKLWLCLFLSAMCLATVFASDIFVKSDLYPQVHQTVCKQLGLQSTDISIPNDSISIAIGSSDYPVTPGDVYSIVFYTQNPNGSSYSTISQDLVVDASYNISVPYIGLINSKGMKFIEFKHLVESQMEMFYSYLNPQLTISKCGTFQIHVSGEVKCTTDVTAWRFTRLSDLCYMATDFASTRKIDILYPDQTVKTYDLLEACILGDEENNPYLEPGVKVYFREAEKTVFVSGAVKMPGLYQLKSNEKLSDLLLFAKGFSYDADRNSLLISSYKDGSYETVKLNYDENQNYELKDMDTISVTSFSESFGTITIQGAIKEGRLNYKFVKGESALQVIAFIKDSLLSTSDIDNVYVERDSLKLACSSDNDIKLQDGDVIQIPYLKQTITVSGAVNKPGTYSYEPGKNAEYYINLSGGFTADAREKTLKVLDQNGDTINSINNILPDYTVTVKRRNTNAASNITLGISLASFAITLFSSIMSNIK